MAGDVVARFGCRNCALLGPAYEWLISAILVHGLQVVPPVEAICSVGCHWHESTLSSLKGRHNSALMAGSILLCRPSGPRGLVRWA